MTTAAVGDYFPIVDSAGNITKKVTPAGVAAAIGVNIPSASLTKSQVNLSTFASGTDANGWVVTFNSLGKKVYTKKISQAISLGNGISFANYPLGSGPVDVGVNLANYYSAFGILMPTGARQISSGVMYGGSSIELGVINHFTGGTYASTAIITITITEP